MASLKPASATSLSPARVILTPGELAAGLSELGLEAPKALWNEPPKAAPLPDVWRERPQIKAMAQVLANAGFALGVDVFVPGSDSFVEARFVAAAPQPPFVMLARTPDGDFDLAYLPQTAQALGVVDDLLGLTRGPSGEGAFSVTLSMPALATLAAFGDLIQEELLRRRLDRAPGPPRAPFEPLVITDLLTTAKAGVKSGDVRWGSALASLISSGATEKVLTVEGVGQGVRDLIDAGLVDDGSVASTVAVGLANMLSTPAAAALVTSVNPTMVEQLAIWRSPAGLLAGLWEQRDGQRVLTLSERSAGAILAMIQDAMTIAPPAAPAAPTEIICPSCGEANEPDDRFCGACGAKLVA